MTLEPLTDEYLEKLTKELDEFDDKRDQVYDHAREIIKLSKLCIYAVRRGEMERAKKLIEQMKEIRKKLFELVDGDPRLAGINIILTADQEFVEAHALYSFLKEGKLPVREDLGVSVQEYVSGIMDAAGEMLRVAVDKLLKGDVKFAEKIRDAIEQIYLAMIKINPRDYELRRKIDYVSNILSKLQEFLFYKKVMPFGTRKE